MNIINFDIETVIALNKYGYSVDDIDWIGTRNFTIPVNEFFDAARRTNYNAGYGSVAMPVDLLIVMKDGSWYSRKEYDGSEWWAYNIAPAKPSTRRHLKVRNFNVDYLWEDPTLIKICDQEEV